MQNDISQENKELSELNVSVAMPTFQGEPYLSPLLDSILNQTRKPNEIVIIDDGSSDGTWSVLEEYDEANPEMFQIKQNEKNMGVRKNFEQAIKHCSGDIIVLADQDDVWMPEKLEKQVKTLYNEPAGMVFHNSVIVSENLSSLGDLWSSVNFNANELDSIGLFYELLRRNVVQGTTIAFEADLRRFLLPIPNVGFYDHWIALVGHITAGLYPIDECLLKYRQHDGQDLGAPPGFYPIFTQIRIGLDKEPEMSVRDANRSQELIVRLSGFSDDTFALSSLTVWKAIHDRLTYDERRKIIHSYGVGKKPVWGFIKAIVEGQYSRFGYGKFGALSIGRDFLGLIGI